MNIAICDDEQAIREQINELIVKEKPGVCPELYETGDGLLAAGKQFDIVFLDIQMEGTGGIETARKLRERDEEPVEEDKFREVFRWAEREIVFSFRIYQDMAAPQEERTEKIILENQITQMQSSHGGDGTSV